MYSKTVGIDNSTMVKTRFHETDCKNKSKISKNTNPRYKNFVQAIFTAGDVEQFTSQRIRTSLRQLSPPLIYHENTAISTRSTCGAAIKRFAFDGSRCDELLGSTVEQGSELNVFNKPESRDVCLLKHVWEKYTNINSGSVNNTFNYLFYKFKKGIFVRIANNTLESFIPFSNANYINEFSHLIKIDPRFKTPEDFFSYISALQNYKQTQQVKPLNEWYANNSLIRYDTSEGDHNLLILYDLLITLCKSRTLPDIEFFINRRDFPLMKVNETEPYDQIFGKNTPLVSHKYSKYAPVISFSSNSEFADILMPTYEDWARSIYQETNHVFPHECRVYPEVVQTAWQTKIKKAVFRGSSTGEGVSNGHDEKPGPVNTRLALYYLAQQRAGLYEPSGKEQVVPPSAAPTGASRLLVDVGITKWNLRPRKLESSPYLQTITFSDEQYPSQRQGSLSKNKYRRAASLSLQEQSRYKYIINVEGNVAAYRLSYELSAGSVILLVNSKWKMWYYDLLKPYKHYIPVHQDLSDLFTQIKWCQDHDDLCAQIAVNAKRFYDKYLSSDSILDFWQIRLWDLYSFTGSYDYLPDLIKEGVLDEFKKLKETLPGYTDTSDILCGGVSIPSKLNVNKFEHQGGEQTIYNLQNFIIAENNTPLFRCIGLLDGLWKVFRTSQHNLRRVSEKFKSANSSIALYILHGFKLVAKTANNESKRLENIHENFLGLNAINQLASKLPNFCYIFGSLNDPNTIFIEYVPGLTLFDWLKSPQYNFKQLLMIMTQLNLAIYVAQNYNGFVHNDTHPWNIILHDIKNSKDIKFKDPLQPISYFIDTSTVLAVESDLIPVLIDYGKARAIVYDEKWGLIDHSVANKFKHGQLQDTLTLLYSVLNVLLKEKRLSSAEKALLEFPKTLGLPDYENIKRWAKYGALFTFTSTPDAPKLRNGLYSTPKQFIDFLLLSTSISPTDKPKIARQNIKINPFRYKIQEGINPIFVETFLQTGDKVAALQNVIKSINKSRHILLSPFMYKIHQGILTKRLEWLMTEFNKPKCPVFLKRQWDIVTYPLFSQKGQLRPGSIDGPVFDVDVPNELWFDENITLQELKEFKLKLNPSINWIEVVDVLTDAFLFQFTPLNQSCLNLCNINRFEMFNKIASHHTVNKLLDTYH
jgi:hypothetical protein